MLDSSPAPKPPSSRRLTIALVIATISTVFPGFLVGALSQQLRAEFEVSEARFGWAVGSFFLAAMAGSLLLGRLGQLIGPRRQIAIALTVSVLVQLAIATAAQSFGAIIALLAVAGLANSGNQSAVNLALGQAQLPRLGVAVAFKQSSMPAASMLAGFAVPTISLTLGWRWAFVIGALLATVSIVVMRLMLRDESPTRGLAAASRPLTNSVPVSTRSDLLLASAALMFLAFSAGVLTAWTVASAAHAGLTEGFAGLSLSLGAACGISVRIFLGFRLDRSRSPFAIAAYLTLVGVAGLLLMSLANASPEASLLVGPAGHTLGTMVAFGAGWVWPVPSNFGVIRTNGAAAGAATGFTQTGVYIGVALGAPIGGWVIQRFGFTTLWLLVAAASATGAILTLAVRSRFALPDPNVELAQQPR